MLINSSSTSVQIFYILNKNKIILLKVISLKLILEEFFIYFLF